MADLKQLKIKYHSSNWEVELTYDLDFRDDVIDLIKKGSDLITESILNAARMEVA